MKTRSEIGKDVRRLEIISFLFMAVGVVAVLVMGWGTLGVIGVLVIFLAVSWFSFTRIQKAACEYCGCTDVFEKTAGFTSGVRPVCPECHKKLKANVPMDELMKRAEQKAEKKRSS